MNRFMAMLRQRCPRCREGLVFRGLWTMNDPCPVCGLVFEREPGYFLGALYVSYPLSALAMTTIFYFGRWLWPAWNEMTVALVAFIVYLPLIPLVFRYGRVIWLHYDRLLAPSEASSHAGWLKSRDLHR